MEAIHRIASGASSGLPVKVFNADGSLHLNINAFPRFAGPVRVALGDVNGDGIPDVIAGGVTVAAGDVNGDDHADLIVGAGPGASPIVKVPDGATGQPWNTFLAFNALFRGVVSVAAGDVTGDNRADIVTSPASAGAAWVKVFNGVTGALEHSFGAYTGMAPGGLNVAAADVTGDGRADILTALGAGGSPLVRRFNGVTAGMIDEFFAYATDYTGGVQVAGR
jgi:hypothetical protein